MAKRAKAGEATRTVGLVRGETTGTASPSKSRASDTSRAFASGLYVVATPIGNASDITLRALELLRSCDAILVEDSRVTAKLLAIHGISRPLLVYNDHTADQVRERIVERLRRGEVLALVTDAGTPLVSDPGFRLVRAVADEGLKVVPLPGASALLAALVVAGLPSDRFLFAGFLPPKSAARRAELHELARIPATLVFYESPQRIGESLHDMADQLGDRPAAVLRELTKMHEEARRGSLRALSEHYQGIESKGEIVVVVGPPSEEVATSGGDIDARLRDEMTRASLKEAVAIVAAETGLPRREVYARALALTRETQR
jgi:16S rRNA (cytidine1402-2'-O)-methyltransferase